MSTVRVARESAHVYSRVIDKSTVPNTITWAALVCVTAPKGELNTIYTLQTQKDLKNFLGTPTTDNISLICADKLLSEGCSLYAIRVAHENSLASSNAIIKTKSFIVDGQGTYDVQGDIAQSTKVNLHRKDEDKNLRNLTSYLTFTGEESAVYTMTNVNVPLEAKQVYQIGVDGEKGNAVTKYCLILSDILKDGNVKVYAKGSNTPIDSNKYESNWFYGEGKNKVSAIVLDLGNSPLAVNDLADISFEAKQMFVQNTGSTNSSDIYCYMQYKSGNSDDIVFSEPNFIIE